ncbi:hypothetical protein GCM10020221_29900 [Streptomyces thioluteus]|uniref:NUDIX hydrolase n=1 Tax=Streptomyces thioluteus TaxID=66431 RepID=A0ABN3WZ32_STRTU
MRRDFRDFRPTRSWTSSDEHDRVVGQAPRGEIYTRRLRHRCTFVQVRDAEGRIFVHRRTAQKLIFPSR